MTPRKLAGIVAANVVPDRVFNALYVARAAPYWRRGRVVFIHTPKNAGMSFTRALYGRPLGHITAADARRFAPRTWAQLYTFGICRHPENRFMSAVRYARSRWDTIAGSPGLPKARAWLDDSERFLTDWVAPRRPTDLNFIFQPQYHFLADATGVLVDDVFRFEDFATTVRVLETRLGRPLTLSRENETDGTECEPLTTAARATLAEVYRRDYELFDYPLPDADVV